MPNAKRNYQHIDKTKIMKQRIIIVILLCFAGQLVIGQNNKIAFEKFASNKDSLMVLAYKSRDTLAYKNQLNELISEYNKLGKTEQKNYESSVMNAYYNFACTYALINEKNKALDYLEKSKYYDYNHLLVDKDLDNIRNVKRFKNFLKYAKERTPIYLKTLKNAKKYNFKDKRELLKFTYQSNNNSNLIFLRKTFKLDSIAGEGSDILKIISLLHWVHNIITHDGNNGNPEIKNAYSLITACKKENKTLNCRGMAIVLNEVYLSMGYKSRFVTCLPKDSTDHDCHVINMVFASSLNKWIWMDPTFNAYVMNEKGELLGLEEVRERLINNKPLY